MSAMDFLLSEFILVCFCPAFYIYLNLETRHCAFTKSFQIKTFFSELQLFRITLSGKNVFKKNSFKKIQRPPFNLNKLQKYLVDNLIISHMCIMPYGTGLAMADCPFSNLIQDCSRSLGLKLQPRCRIRCGIHKPSVSSWCDM